MAGGVWAGRSIPVIRQVLDALPAGASVREAKQALSAAYPFGVRKHHPYRAWLKECAKALAARFRKVETAPRAIRYLVSRRKGRLWLEVDCHWCRDLQLQSCLSCGRMREALPPLCINAEFGALAKAGSKDDVAMRAFLDFCEEWLGVRPELWIGLDFGIDTATPHAGTDGVMRHFAERQISEAYEYAATGGQALHTHRILNRNLAPKCFVDAVDRGEDIAHLFDMDAVRLRQTARKLGVKVVRIDREGTPKQHIDLCGAPLRKALELCDS